MLPVKIAGLGYYIPERRVTNAYFEQKYGFSSSWISQVTGVYERRYVTDETTVQMGVHASRMALQSARLSVDHLDAIVCASAAPQQMIPCTAALLQHALGAPEGRSACVDVNATCMSFLFALQMVSHMVASGTYHTVLICSSEIPSTSLNPAEPESATLFGDAAAAAIITRTPSGETSVIWHSQFATYSSGAELTQIPGGGTLHHPNNPATTPDMNLFHMEGPALFRQGLPLIGPFLDSFFSHLPYDRATMEAVVPHQASRHAIELLHRRLGFQQAQIINTLAFYGNCVAASIPLTFAEAVHNGRIKRGNRVALLGTGAGLTLGALALTF
jgi:3-oxoacyl-[acyl-carrier-protein] synthase-3